MAVDNSWMIAFLDDLREIARQRGLCDLARDLEVLVNRHSVSLDLPGEDLRACGAADGGGSPVLPFRRPAKDG